MNESEPAKRRPGRPPLSGDVSRPMRVTASLTIAERERLAQLTDDVPGFVRRAVLAAMDAPGGG